MWPQVEALERQKRDSWHNTTSEMSLFYASENHMKERLDLDMPLKPHTYLFNILIQLLIRINLPHQVLQLLFAENLTGKQKYPFFYLHFLCILCAKPKLMPQYIFIAKLNLIPQC